MSTVKQVHKKRYIRLIAGVFYVALGTFLYFYIQTIDFSTISTMQVMWQFVIVASVFGLAMRFWQIFIWFTILRSLGAQDLDKSRKQLAYVYAKSWMARYIPGTAPAILSKIYFASRHGISKSKLALSSLLETAIQVATVLTLGCVLLVFDERFNTVDPTLRLLMTIALGMCMLFLTPPIFNRLMSLVYQIVRKKPLEKQYWVTSPTIIKGAVLYIASGLLYGLFLFFVAKALYPSLGYENLLFIIGAGNLAGALGILAVFTPSGLGVRDSMQLLLFSLVMPVEFALAITIVTRLWDVVLDAVFFGIAWLVRRKTSLQ